jgi:hypothetical protein
MSHANQKTVRVPYCEDPAQILKYFHVRSHEVHNGIEKPWLDLMDEARLCREARLVDWDQVWLSVLVDIRRHPAAPHNQP